MVQEEQERATSSEKGRGAKGEQEEPDWKARAESLEAQLRGKDKSIEDYRARQIQGLKQKDLERKLDIVLSHLTTGDAAPEELQEKLAQSSKRLSEQDKATKLLQLEQSRVEDDFRDVAETLELKDPADLATMEEFSTPISYYREGLETGDPWFFQQAREEIDRATKRVNRRREKQSGEQSKPQRKEDLDLASGRSATPIKASRGNPDKDRDLFIKGDISKEEYQKRQASW